MYLNVAPHSVTVMAVQVIWTIFMLLKASIVLSLV
jgi:hypothetical protein